jgi:hypothetical protein
LDGPTISVALGRRVVLLQAFAHNFSFKTLLTHFFKVCCVAPGPAMSNYHHPAIMAALQACQKGNNSSYQMCMDTWFVSLMFSGRLQQHLDTFSL